MNNLFVYSPLKSNGARDLVKAVGGRRLRNFDGLNFWDRGKKVVVPEDSIILNWGGRLPELDGIKVINGGGDVDNKKDELIQLLRKGIKIPTMVQSNPHQYGPSKNEWIPRRFQHAGGADLLSPPIKPGFWTMKLNLTEEFRIHSFDGLSIKAGRKDLRAGYTVAASEQEWKEKSATGALIAHPWWRSYDTGWFINYRSFKSSKDMREIAKQAVTALGLVFGAVDLGKDAENNIYVIEVNRAPGIENTTIDAYTRAIRRWTEKLANSPLQPVEEVPKVEAPPHAALDPDFFAAQHDQWREGINREVMERMLNGRNRGMAAQPFPPDPPAPIEEDVDDDDDLFGGDDYLDLDGDDGDDE